jgi:hypothetical protein
MTLPRSAADVLASHVTFELECIDRVYCNLYVPKLQRDLGVVGFIREHLGKPAASAAVLSGRGRCTRRSGSSPPAAASRSSTSSPGGARTT